MIISARFIRFARKFHLCAGRCSCNIEQTKIRGPHIRLYGRAEPGDAPFTLRLCLECASVDRDPKIRTALWMAEAWIPVRRER